MSLGFSNGNRCDVEENQTELLTAGGWLASCSGHEPRAVETVSLGARAWGRLARWLPQRTSEQAKCQEQDDGCPAATRRNFTVLIAAFAPRPKCIVLIAPRPDCTPS
jgi:hypothetical protein